MNIKILVAIALITGAAHAKEKEQNSDNCKKTGGKCICFNSSNQSNKNNACTRGAYTTDDGVSTIGYHCSCRDQK